MPPANISILSSVFTIGLEHREIITVKQQVNDYNIRSTFPRSINILYCLLQVCLIFLAAVCKCPVLNTLPSSELSAKACSSISDWSEQQSQLWALQTTEKVHPVPGFKLLLLSTWYLNKNSP